MADDTVEIWVGGRPVGPSNPVPTTSTGGGGGAVSQGPAGADPWKVDDDATQALLTALAGAKSLADVVSAVAAAQAATTVANFPADQLVHATNIDLALTALRDAIVKTGGTSKTLADLATLLSGGLPAALAAGGGLKTEGVVGGVAQPVSGTVTANLQPVTSGGSTPYRNLDLGTTGQIVKASAGQLYNYFIGNQAAALRFIKVYDKATAPTQSDTPVWTLPLPAGSAANVAFPNGIGFANGISLRATTGVADSDTGAPSANDVIVNLGYK